MDTNYIKNHINYESRGETFNEVSKERLIEILIDYYFNSLTLSKLIEKYNLNTNLKNIRSDFPNLTSNLKCQYDGNLMISKLPSKESVKFDIEESNYECIVCGHRQSINCRCDNCRKYYQQIIKNHYENQNLDLVDLENISLMDRLNISEILQINHARSLEDITSDNKLNIQAYYELLAPLFDKNLLTISSNSTIESFKMADNFPNVFYPTEVNFNININSSIDKLKFLTDENLLSKYKSDEIKDVYKKIVISELIKLLTIKMDEYNLKLVSRNEKEKNNIEDITNLFNRMLKTLSPGQIYSLIWKGTRDANDSKDRNKWGNYKYHQLSFVLLKIDSVWKLYKNNNYEIKSFDIPYDYVKDLKTDIFFDFLLEKPNWFSEVINF
ncbi:hypothetical protein [Fructilactobacillus frigidiflavus]|uniref:hypothetical protein n=1 Tax=Fructilactobacillus frigidiflavus TaxID=3242688 RepID=UPI003757E014